MVFNDLAHSPSKLKATTEKKLESITEQQVAEAFDSPGLMVLTDSDKLFAFLKTQKWESTNLLLMTSGNFSGKNLKELAGELVKN